MAIYETKTSPFVSEFSDLPIAKLRAYLDACEQPFKPSQLYSPAAEAKYVDTDQRVSAFRAIVSAECFGLVRCPLKHDMCTACAAFSMRLFSGRSAF